MPDLDIAQDALLFGEEFVLDSHMSNNMETLLDSGHQPLVCPHLSDPPLYSDIPVKTQHPHEQLSPSPTQEDDYCTPVKSPSDIYDPSISTNLDIQCPDIIQATNIDQTNMEKATNDNTRPQNVANDKHNNTGEQTKCCLRYLN